MVNGPMGILKTLLCSSISSNFYYLLEFLVISGPMASLQFLFEDMPTDIPNPGEDNVNCTKPP